MDDAARLALLEEQVAELRSQLLVRTRALQQVMGVVLAYVERLDPLVMHSLERLFDDPSAHPGTTGGVAGVDAPELRRIHEQGVMRREKLASTGLA